jgi:CheY-like chemotaxis protein
VEVVKEGCMAHILIIEDYPDNRDITALILIDAGHTVTTACNGINGLHLAASTKPDLILMDLALPVLDGWEATRLLKSSPQTRHIPVIAFTAQVDEESVTLALSAGCACVIAKPFELSEFLDDIATVLAQHSSTTHASALSE